MGPTPLARLAERWHRTRTSCAECGTPLPGGERSVYCSDRCADERLSSTAV